MASALDLTSYSTSAGAKEGIDVAYNSEFGRETSVQSSLNLLYLLDSVKLGPLLAAYASILRITHLVENVTKK